MSDEADFLTKEQVVKAAQPTLKKWSDLLWHGETLGGQFREKGYPFQKLWKGFWKGGSACHAWIQSGAIVLTGYNVVKSVSCGCEEDAHYAFIRWLISDENPLAVGILNRNNPDQCANGGLIIDGSVLLRDEVLWLCKAARCANECPNIVNTWYMFVTDHKIPPMVAFYLASHLKYVKTSKLLTPQVQNGHVNVFTSYYLGSGVVKQLVNPSRKRTQDDGGFTTSDCFLDDRGPDKSDIQKELIPKWSKETAKDDGWGGFINSKGIQPKTVADYIHTLIGTAKTEVVETLGLEYEELDR